jgi:hypothetical protein
MHEPTAEEWKQLIAKSEKSGMSQKEFAAQHDLALSKFQYRLYKRSKGKAKATVGEPPRFVPVEVEAPAHPMRDEGGWLQAILLSGVVVRFAPGTDPRYLAELFAALG